MSGSELESSEFESVDTVSEKEVSESILAVEENNPVSEEASTEDKPVEETTPEGKPTEDKPVEEEAPVEDKPVEENKKSNRGRKRRSSARKASKEVRTLKVYSRPYENSNYKSVTAVFQECGSVGTFTVVQYIKPGFGLAKGYVKNF